MRDLCTFGHSSLPVVTTAIHAGHDLRPAIASRLQVDEATRRREEDPYTDVLTGAGGAPLIMHRSRFEVDLNRPRDRAVYRSPEDAWGLELWREPLPEREVERSLALYDAFYRSLSDRLDELVRAGPFVVLDLHSYNHRRAGPDAPADPAEGSPEVNVGTGSLDRSRWGHLVDRFMADLAASQVRGAPLDVRENVRFRGGHLCRWVRDRYEDHGCALAIELKKVFMDEWTGVVDHGHLRALTQALAAALPAMVLELSGAHR